MLTNEFMEGAPHVEDASVLVVFFGEVWIARGIAEVDVDVHDIVETLFGLALWNFPVECIGTVSVWLEEGGKGSVNVGVLLSDIGAEGNEGACMDGANFGEDLCLCERWLSACGFG